MISQDITLDKLFEDIDHQIEILMAIAHDSSILTEQLRLMQESRELLRTQNLEIARLTEMIDPDALADFSTLMEKQADKDPQ